MPLDALAPHPVFSSFLHKCWPGSNTDGETAACHEVKSIFANATHTRCLPAQCERVIYMFQPENMTAQRSTPWDSAQLVSDATKGVWHKCCVATDGTATCVQANAEHSALCGSHACGGSRDVCLKVCEEEKLVPPSEDNGPSTEITDFYHVSPTETNQCDTVTVKQCVFVGDEARATPHYGAHGSNSEPYEVYMMSVPAPVVAATWIARNTFLQTAKSRQQFL
mmetsp:Transcript_28383/g.68168  ORF Transcript_28383/g.68168 Transcript_28383/m.68168 type:complete len:223 (+) Transcript_28383:63-731(+)